jgi:hypothetical protein
MLGWGDEWSAAMSNKSASAVATIGIDIWKNSVHVIGLDERGAIVLRQKWSAASSKHGLPIRHRILSVWKRPLATPLEPWTGRLLARPMLRGTARLRFKFTFTMAACNLIRLSKLLGVSA